MLVKCGFELCNKTERGRYWKLKKEGWLIIFIRGHSRVERCPFHKPELWEKRKNFKEFDSELMKSIKDELTERFKELNMLSKL